MKNQFSIIDESGLANPFLLENESAYQQWREQKLFDYPKSVEDLLVPVADLGHVSPSEKNQLLAKIRKANMAFYQSQPTSDKSLIRQFCHEFGLHRLDHNLCSDDDGISALQVVPGGTHAEYIPYSNHAIRWHTDGYYNAPEQTIRGMVLHCVSPAREGGANQLLDPEIVYLLMRDADREFIRAFMQADVMTIPANVQNGVEIRPAQTGPVFSIGPDGSLHMRYTARSRSIHWKQDSATKKAVQCLEHLLGSDTAFGFSLNMKAGQGLLSNNVLHTRSAFSDDASQQRLMFRARFYDRIV